MEKSLYASRPSEHSPVRGKNVLFLTFSVVVVNPRKASVSARSTNRLDDVITIITVWNFAYV